MPYIEGFVAAVPKANKAAYIKHASEAAGYFKKLGATRLVECWGDDVPKGALTDFYKATQAKDDEVPVFSWIEYPDPRRRQQEDAGRPRHGEHGYALRRQAHVLGRLRAGGEHVALLPSPLVGEGGRAERSDCEIG